MEPLQVHVSSIEEVPKRFRLRPDAEWWAEFVRSSRDPEARQLEPIELVLQGHRVGRRLLFRGELHGVVELVCSRCAEPYAHGLSDQVALLLEPLPPSAEPPPGGLELDPEDLSLARYAGEELDFGPVLAETLLTCWPMQPRCAEDCRGLCPICGENRNRVACECETGRGNRPFEALGELLKPTQGNDPPREG